MRLSIHAWASSLATTDEALDLDFLLKADRTPAFITSENTAIMILLAQQATVAPSNSTVFYFIVFGAVVVVLGLLAAIGFGYMGILQARKNRELLHLERVKAFEYGVLWQEPGSSSNHQKFMHNAFYISFWIVCFGCGGSFTAAGNLTARSGVATSVLIIAWLATAAASIAACICATVLMIRSKKQADMVNPQAFFRPPMAELVSSPVASQDSSDHNPKR